MTISLNRGTPQVVVSAGSGQAFSWSWNRWRKYCMRETSVDGLSCRPGSWSYVLRWLIGSLLMAALDGYCEMYSEFAATAERVDSSSDVPAGSTNASPEAASP